MTSGGRWLTVSAYAALGTVPWFAADRTYKERTASNYGAANTCLRPTKRGGGRLDADPEWENLPLSATTTPGSSPPASYLLALVKCRYRLAVDFQRFPIPVLADKAKIDVQVGFVRYGCFVLEAGERVKTGARRRKSQIPSACALRNYHVKLHAGVLSYIMER